ncbi:MULTISPECIES: hypothetical protein [Pseudoalteromonas]|uniref:hypothetical protein n=1 Tax=Pseudoalteromonas TaxID=53246 RepID=UPI000F78B6BE|nr:MULTISPECIES: hypothetical protein [Pseudoalteromonas]MCG7562163.1 hypothetical protein [Pseudoalteromonas sp. McH1-42]MEC4091194.1 hypothetical protein [Pseudoalteromonas rubra]
MKLKLNKKPMKALSPSTTTMPVDMTPKVAGGSLLACLPVGTRGCRTNNSCDHFCFISDPEVHGC